MPFTKKPYKPKGELSRNTTAMFPSLHEDVADALSDAFISPEPWFNPTGGDDDAITVYDTHIMGRFDCRNPACAKQGWGSKKISILIRQYPDNGYNAVVFKQRCKACERVGALRLDENSYVERVTYRLKKWAGIRMETPEYNGNHRGPPHEYDLCEGCKRGYCQRVD
ncbi:hypothetical protein C8A01DRAFT_37067 [Parachaetomium inaequale]|uniref:3CxxC-type domain-containing protein n=1 Tax=Parachaetomium inaequale TaxID=2588326 RepID=A0AAN6PE51_9PEZI|nr:hypothetical protein C8A01DRAFT_37067 [Parachaetomium inaequale]